MNKLNFEDAISIYKEMKSIEEDLNKIYRLTHASLIWTEGSPAYNMSVDINASYLMSLKNAMQINISACKAKLQALGIEL